METNPVKVVQVFRNHGFHFGRMLSGSKISPPGQTCVWNANVVTRSMGKVWYGDLNLTKDGDKLKAIASEIGEPLYVLREMDCRFETEGDPVEVLIGKAVWSTV